MRRVTDTFHIEFNTLTYPGKIESVEVTLRRHITSDPAKQFRLDLNEHPLYAALCRYCAANPPRNKTS